MGRVVKQLRRCGSLNPFENAAVGMLLSMLLAFAFALGYHFFYASLATKAVPSDDVFNVGSVRISTQQLNTTVGNASANLVKLCLAIAVPIAYVQLCWRAVQSQPSTVSTIDTLFGALIDATQLAKVTVWWRYPILLCLAFIAW